MASETKITIRRLLELQSGLGIIEAASLEVDLAHAMPIKTSYWCGRNGDKVEAEVRSYRKTLQKLFLDGSVKDDKGRAKYSDRGNGQIKYELTDPVATREEQEKLLDVEIVISDLRVLRLDEFGSFPVPPGAVRLLLGTIIEDREPGTAAA